MKVNALLFLLAFGSTLQAQLSDAEQRALSDSLFLQNKSLTDLNYDKHILKNVAAAPLMLEGLNRPLATAEKLMDWHRKSEDDSILALNIRMASVYLGSERQVALKLPSVEVPQEVPTELKGLVADLVATLLACDESVRAAYAKLSIPQHRQVIESLPVDSVETNDVKFSYVDASVVSHDELLKLVDQVDRERLYVAANYLNSAVDKAVATLLKTKTEFQGKLKIKVGGLPIVIAGVGSDLHEDTDARLTIDLGGNDVYRGRHGAGIGHCSIHIDLSGDDQYNLPDLSLGAGVMGVGIAYDLAGDDSYTTHSISLGCGLLGVGIFMDGEGNDQYRSTSLAQGYGIYGSGLCLDKGGDDTYRIGLLGQGAARTNGFGWLIDRKGKDIYRAGGIQLNSPLFDTVHYSFAQGFGMGYRLDDGGQAGGIGMLSDHAGYDSYLGETYCQGASYFYGLGALLDTYGNDSYTAHHYSQASAMHLTSAYLLDLSGDDLYSVRYGAGHAIGHDWSTAMLLDRSGNDLYAAYDTRPGLGINYGTGIFVDGAGDDTYGGKPGFGQARSMSLSIGVFADLSGKDKYRNASPEDVAWVDGPGGSGIDYPTLTFTKPADDPDRPEIVVGSRQRPSDQELDKLWQDASAWRVGQAAAQSDRALDELAKIGLPALNYILDSKLASMNRLGTVALHMLISRIGQDAVAALGAKALRATDAEMFMILQTAVRGNIKDVGSLIPGVLESRPALKRYAVSAAGVLQARGAVDMLQPILLDDDPTLARSAMISLALIGDRAAIGSASSLLTSRDPLVREAALNLLKQFPDAAFTIGKTLIAVTDEQQARYGLELIKAANQAETLTLLTGALGDPRPGMRIQALILLAGICPDASKETYLALRNDPDPRVSLIARGLEP